MATAHITKPPMLENTTTNNFNTLLDEDSPIKGIVSIDINGKLTGFAHFVSYPCTYPSDLVGYIQDLYVGQKYRRQGIASELINAIKEIGQKEGWTQIRWRTNKENEIAKKLYDKIATRCNRVNYTMQLK